MNLDLIIYKLFNGRKLKKIIEDKKERKEFLKKRYEKPEYNYLILLPQCLRSNYCKAEREEGIVLCESCNSTRKDGITCYIPELVGYSSSFINGKGKIEILMGGSSLVDLIIKYGKPEKCLGVACNMELELGKFLMESIKVDVYTVPLIILNKKCSETRLNKNLFYSKLNKMTKPF